MEVKATLNKPCTDKQRMDFIVTYNHDLGYIIEETEEAYEAWGYTEEEEADLREADFKDNFFFIPTFGWYRKVPKGYSSAVESLNTILISALPIYCSSYLMLSIPLIDAVISSTIS